MPLELQIVILGLASFLTGIVSGMAGGGAGLVMVPLAIAVGLPPQTAVGTMKMAGLGSSLGGLSIFAKSGHIKTDIVKVMVPIIVIIGIITPFVFQLFNAAVFQKIIGLLILALTPTLFLKKQAVATSRKRKILGYTALSAVMSLQALFGTGTGSLATFALTLLLGTTKLEANATKRALSAMLVPLTFIGLLVTGFVSLPHGLVLLCTGFIGTHIGSKIAVKKGEDFVKYIMAGLAVVSGLWLVLH